MAQHSFRVDFPVPQALPGRTVSFDIIREQLGNYNRLYMDEEGSGQRTAGSGTVGVGEESWSEKSKHRWLGVVGGRWSKWETVRTRPPLRRGEHNFREKRSKSYPRIRTKAAFDVFDNENFGENSHNTQPSPPQESPCPYGQYYYYSIPIDDLKSIASSER